MRLNYLSSTIAAAFSLASIVDVCAAPLVDIDCSNSLLSLSARSPRADTLQLPSPPSSSPSSPKVAAGHVKSVGPGAVLKTAPAKQQAGPFPSDHKKDVNSKIIFTFWTVEQYTTEVQAYHHSTNRPMIDIHRTECNGGQRSTVAGKIRTFLIGAATNPHPHTGAIALPHQGTLGVDLAANSNCLTQWLPVYQRFDFEIKDGVDGKCGENAKCSGIVYASGEGVLWDHLQRQFYATITPNDLQAVQTLHDNLAAAASLNAQTLQSSHASSPASSVESEES